MFTKKIGISMAALSVSALLPFMTIQAEENLNQETSEKQLQQDEALEAKTLMAKGIGYPHAEYPPEVEHLLHHKKTYKSLYKILHRNLQNLTLLFSNVTDEATYEVFYNAMVSVANSVDGGGGRMLFCEPDGTVVVDTSKVLDSSNVVSGYANSYQHWQNKNVNENHNSRVAIMSAQIWPAGLGVEKKFSSTIAQTSWYVAEVANYHKDVNKSKSVHLDNKGTFRISSTNALSPT